MWFWRPSRRRPWMVVQRGILMMLMRLQRQLKNTLVLVSQRYGVHYQITNRMYRVFKKPSNPGKTE